MRRHGRVNVVLAALLVALLGVAPAGPSRAGPGPSSPPSRLWLATPVTGFKQPTLVANAGDGSGRLFVSQLPGQVSIARNGSVLATPFLDLSALATCKAGGLVAVTFSPHYATTGQFYVAYDDSGCNLVVVRYHVGANPDRADPASGQIVLSIPMAQAGVLGHAGCQLSFSPVDGDLYVSVGDGSNGGDPQNLAQDPGSLLGKILRVDVETGSPATYTVPADNPFVGRAGYRPEIWALGLRNPFRLTFDRVTGAMYVADVGENSWEEVDFAPPGDRGGENYGWPTMEGAHCFRTPSCDQTGLTLPVWEYDHSGGDCAVIGGEVYRGSAAPTLDGTYVYGDLCTGNIWGLTQKGAGWTNQLLDTTSFSITGFGPDEQGELWLADFTDGAVFRLTTLEPAPVDRSLTLTAPATVVPTKPFTSHVTVTNNSASPANNVVITDDLGPAFSVGSVAAPGATCTHITGGRAQCRLVTLPAGTTVTMSVVAKAKSPGSTVEQATVTANEPDPTPADDSAQSTVQVLQLQTISVTPNPVTGGQTATGTVVISVPAPSGGVIVKLSSSAARVASVGSTVTIPAGQTAQTFPVKTGRVPVTTTAVIAARLTGSPSPTFTVTVNP